MDDYYFLYLDSLRNWYTATNPSFIASHTHCRAIPKKEIHALGYALISDFVYDLNNDKTKAQQLINAYELY